jgi:hypothetical protein
MQILLGIHVTLALGLTLCAGALLSGRRGALWPSAVLALGVAVTGGALVHDFKPGGWVAAGVVSVLIVLVTLALMWRVPDARVTRAGRRSLAPVVLAAAYVMAARPHSALAVALPAAALALGVAIEAVTSGRA